MTRVRSIASSYRRPIFTAVAIQSLVAVLASLVLDGGTTGRLCGIALIAFWSGAALIIGRRPDSPTDTDLDLIRVGYLPLASLAFALHHFLYRA